MSEKVFAEHAEQEAEAYAVENVLMPHGRHAAVPPGW